MSEKPELPSAEAVAEGLSFEADTWGSTPRPVAQMLRAQHEALREPWCPAVGCVRGFTNPVTGDHPKPCEVCNGTGLNRRSRAVLELGEAVGMGEAKETP